MSSVYFMRFGSGDPRQLTGLNPTFLAFRRVDGVGVTPPPIAEVGTSLGIYGFTFAVTHPITFLADAATLSAGPQGRFVVGSLDPADNIDAQAVTLTALGTTAVSFGLANLNQGASIMAFGATSIAVGQSLTAQSATILDAVLSASLSVVVPAIGSTNSSFGTDSQDPDTVFGYLKRLQELLEGNASYGRNSNAWSMYSRGSTTLLRSKTIGSDAVGVTRS